MDSGKSIRNLAVSLHSLLGLKTHLTSNWVKSISDIMKTLPSEKSVDMQATNSDTDDDDDGDDDSDTKIKGKRTPPPTHTRTNLDAPVSLILLIFTAYSSIKTFCEQMN